MNDEDVASLVRLEEAMWQDLRVSWRTLRKRPGFCLIVIFTLSLGIGANETAAHCDSTAWSRGVAKSRKARSLSGKGR